MENELLKALKGITAENLNKEDKMGLLQLFIGTTNILIRNQLAFIFADAHYEEAVPYIINKIADKSTFNKNGSLVYALESFDLKEYFQDILKIICEQDYEARLTAFGILEKLIPRISTNDRSIGLELLDKYYLELEKTGLDQEVNSTLYFIEKTKEMLRDS